ncbi:MAG TPA: SCO family protein [Opitutaceae bacterium]|nr:SCO family protein [Opitutaceae bacterium]
MIFRPHPRAFHVLSALVLAALLSATGCARRQTWQLTDINGNLPDLKFTLATAGNARLTAADFRGQIVLLYFGYVHCPDVCPMTMARLGGIVGKLGPEAAKVRILFVSVDPKRDTPALTETYARAFSPAATGATGSPAEIERLARRYRVAYQAEPVDGSGNYEVMHSKAVYVFDGSGHVRLLIDDTDKPDAVVHDLRQLAQSS